QKHSVSGSIDRSPNTAQQPLGGRLYRALRRTAACLGYGAQPARSVGLAGSRFGRLGAKATRAIHLGQSQSVAHRRRDCRAARRPCYAFWPCVARAGDECCEVWVADRGKRHSEPFLESHEKERPVNTHGYMEREGWPPGQTAGPNWIWKHAD